MLVGVWVVQSGIFVFVNTVGNSGLVTQYKRLMLLKLYWLSTKKIEIKLSACISEKTA